MRVRTKILLDFLETRPPEPDPALGNAVLPLICSCSGSGDGTVAGGARSAAGAASRPGRQLSGDTIPIKKYLAAAGSNVYHRLRNETRPARHAGDRRNPSRQGASHVRDPPHPDRRRRRGAPRHPGGADHARRRVPHRGGRDRGRRRRQAQRGQRPLRRHPARHRPAGRRRPRVLRQAPPRRQAHAGDHADRRRRRAGRGPRPRRRRQRLHRQALPPRRAARPRARPAPRLRQLRGRGVHHRPLHVPPLRQAPPGAGQEPQDPAHRQGMRHPEVPLPRRRPAGAAAGAAERGVGLQQRGDHAHAGDPHLPPAPEDRAGPVPTPACCSPRAAATGWTPQARAELAAAA